METLDYNPKHWEKACPKYDCRKNKCKCGMSYVNIPAVLGSDAGSSPVAPKNGAYCNTIVRYEANGNIYMYSKEGIPILLNNSSDCCPEEPVINLSVVIDDDSWGPKSEYYRVKYGTNDWQTVVVGLCALSPAQGNYGLFINDDTGNFVTVKQAYELIESGNKVRFNHVPVGQHLYEPHSEFLGGNYFDGIELNVKYNVDLGEESLTVYSNSVFHPIGHFPPIGVAIQKIEQKTPYEDTYEFVIEGTIPDGVD